LLVCVEIGLKFGDEVTEKSLKRNHILIGRNYVLFGRKRDAIVDQDWQWYCVWASY